MRSCHKYENEESVCGDVEKNGFLLDIKVLVQVFFILFKDLRNLEELDLKALNSIQMWTFFKTFKRSTDIK